MEKSIEVNEEKQFILTYHFGLKGAKKFKVSKMAKESGTAKQNEHNKGYKTR
ncbi:MAG TPA: hypothetical protein PKH16_02980 [Aequorivita sp.]|nr:hypothetical protein [Aequorivita sp.]